MLIHTQQQCPWGYDFHKDGKVYKEAFGQYSTEVFSNHAEEIIKEHNKLKVCRTVFIFFMPNSA